jgi:hypothetical protein
VNVTRTGLLLLFLAWWIVTIKIPFLETADINKITWEV